MSLEALLAELADRFGWTGRREESGTIVLQIPCEGNRQQKVYITEDRSLDGQPVAKYWTVVGEYMDATNSDALRICLQANCGFLFGAYVLDENNTLMIMDSQLVKEADADEVAAAIRYISSKADLYEKELFGSDRY